MSSNDALDAIARAISGAPFPSARSRAKAQAALDALAAEHLVVVRAEGIPHGATLERVHVAGWDDWNDKWCAALDVTTGEEVNRPVFAVRSETGEA